METCDKCGINSDEDYNMDFYGGCGEYDCLCEQCYEEVIE